MYKRMLVLLDGSRLSETVFSYARELSGRLCLNLDLLHVCSPDESEQLPMRQAYVEHMAEMLKAQSEKLQRDCGIAQAASTIEARSQVVIGYPPEEILKYAEANHVDLIMLSTHGRSGIRRWGIGSVADKVIHETRVPVWLVPAEIREDIIYDKMPSRVIMVPLDGSKLAESILPHVEELVKQRGVDVEVVLVNVGKQVTMPRELWEASREFIGEDISAFRLASEVYLNGIVKQLRTKGINARAEQLIGDPAEEIIRYAADIHPQLIAMSTHGRSGFSRFVFGGVAENILHRLKKTPVFLVRPGE
ncbi:MAG: universal stress protein [Dehalococcoidales bacterium]|jgi:nucleotide-binding universal stress UspA family protein|nr:universal stress protein [Dehalococcoidales bacterium]